MRYIGTLGTITPAAPVRVCVVRNPTPSSPSTCQIIDVDVQMRRYVMNRVVESKGSFVITLSFGTEFQNTPLLQVRRSEGQNSAMSISLQPLWGHWWVTVLAV